MSAPERGALPVRVSLGLSCGHTLRPSVPMRAAEAVSLPGQVVICARHDEWTVVTRITTRMVVTAEALEALLLAAGVDALSAQYVAADQAAGGPA